MKREGGRGAKDTTERGDTSSIHMCGKVGEGSSYRVVVRDQKT